jgi:alpha-N-arabinofuranosidase
VQVADSPNTGWAARVDLGAREGAHGLAQERFNIVRGHKYHGTAWLRAEGDVRNVRAALVGAEGDLLARRSLKPGSDGWTECRFTLSPKRSDGNGTLAITAEGEGALLVDMVSLVRDDSLRTGCRADLLEAVKALKPPIIRWPGGCFASIFRWKRTLGPQHERKPFYNSPWGEWDSGGFGTDEFMRLCRAVNAEPMIVLNLGSWDSPDKWREYLQDALDWVEYCNGDASTPMGKLRAENGRPEPYSVTHWELDNETWGMGVEGYAERLIPFAQAIRERWPNVTLYACTFWEKEDPRLLELAGGHFDIISYHLYDNPDNFGSGPPRFEGIWSRYASFIAESANPKAKLSVTEWNAQSTDWRTGLFAGGLLNVMERQDVVQMASPALFLRRVDAPAWDNAFINLDYRSWFPAPNYVVTKLYREHYQPTRIAMEAAGPLNAVATLSRDKKTLVLKSVNPTAEAVDCAVEINAAFRPKRGRQWVVRADLTDRNTLQEPHHIAPVERPLEQFGAEFVHTFAAHSVTVMELGR